MPQGILNRKGIDKAIYKKMLICLGAELLLITSLGLYYAHREHSKPDLAISTHGTEKQGGGVFYGSKSSKKFGFPWCSGPARLKPENRVVLSSFIEAIAAGFEPTKVCKGLKGYKSIG